MKLATLLVFWLSLALVYSGCKKERDEVPPEVRIQAPVTLSSFNVFDDVTIRVEVSDDKQLTEVSVRYSRSKRCFNCIAGSRYS